MYSNRILLAIPDPPSLHVSKNTFALPPFFPFCSCHARLSSTFTFSFFSPQNKLPRKDQPSDVEVRDIAESHSFVWLACCTTQPHTLASPLICDSPLPSFQHSRVCFAFLFCSTGFLSFFSPPTPQNSPSSLPLYNGLAARSVLEPLATASQPNTCVPLSNTHTHTNPSVCFIQMTVLNDSKSLYYGSRHFY